MNKLNLSEHPTLIQSLSILHMENGDCFANIFCVGGEYFVDSLTYTDMHSTVSSGKAEALHNRHVVYIATVSLESA